MQFHPLLRTRLFAAILMTVIAATAACGPRAVVTPPPPPPIDAPAPPPTEDITAALGPLPLTGSVFTPQAVPPTPMLLVRADKKTTLARERAGWKKLARRASAPWAQKATASQILATLLYDESKAKPVDKAALLAEARAALAVAHAASNGNADAVTLEMSAALAFATNDAAAAEPFLTELVTRFAAEKGGTAAKAQLAFARLKEGKNAEAAALVGDAAPAADAPELAYVIAWLRFRGGDLTGAAAAIQLAAAGWTADAFKNPLLRDYLIMTARAGVPAADAAAVIATLFPARNLRYAFTYQLSKAYGLAGRPELAAAAIDLAIAVVGDTVVKSDLAVYRTEQADYARQANRVEDLVPALTAAKAAFDACTDCADRDKKALGDYISQRAIELHSIYAMTGDPRYQATAKALYALFASLPPRDDSAQIAQHENDLAATSAPDSGAQYPDALVPPLQARVQEAQACYEQVLQGDPTLAGTVTLSLEIDRAGAVAGAAGDPPAGEAGLAAVSRCIEERARTWSMPSRPRDGVARVTVTFGLTPAG